MKHLTVQSILLHDVNFVTQTLSALDVMRRERLIKDVYVFIYYKHGLKQMFLDVKSSASFNLEVVPTPR